MTLNNKHLKSKIDFLHEDFLKEQQAEKRRVRFYQIVIFIVFFSLWETASRLAWIDPLIFSSPSAVWALFLEKMGDGSLPGHIGVTVFETILAFWPEHCLELFWPPSYGGSRGSPKYWIRILSS